jgi:ceramide glucosyltransferase
VLVPLHGAPPHLAPCLTSLCRQDYGGEVQLLLGVQRADDPAAVVAREVIAAFPDRNIEIVIDGTHRGANRKVGNLANLMGHVRHDIVVTADSDIVAPPTYLAQTVAALAQPGTGAATWPYYGIAADSLPGRLAALGLDSHFLPNVLVGLGLGLPPPGLGATIALHRPVLEAAGGYVAFADQLADDHALVAAVQRQGARVAVVPHAVGHVCADESLAALFRHELRWARTIRLVAPTGHAGTLITHPFALALLGVAAAGGWTCGGLALLALVLRAGLREAVARRFGARPPSAWLIPLRDILSFVVFVWSFCGSGVQWGAEAFHVRPDGTLASDRS